MWEWRERELRIYDGLGMGIFRPVSTVVSDLCGIRAFLSLKFNVRGARGNHQFTLPHLCSFACAHPIWRPLFLHLHDNGGLQKFTQSQFWADKCQANISFLFLELMVDSVRFRVKRQILSRWAGKQRQFHQAKSQPNTLGEQRMTLLGSRKLAKNPENPIPATRWDASTRYS